MTEEMKRFMEADPKVITYVVIRKAAKQFWEDYKNVPGYAHRTLDDLDQKYEKAKGEFYTKYVGFIRKCQEVEKEVNNKNWEVRVAASDAKKITFTFPYGWKTFAEANYVEEVMRQKKELGIECPKIDKIEIVSYGTVEE